MMNTQTIPIAFSGKIPENYDRYLGPMFFEPYALAMAERIAALRPKSVLELAAGTGRLTRLLPGIADDGATLTATDINPSMVEFGKQHVSHPSVSWQVIDAVELPFADSSFDCIAVQFGVMFYSDREKAFHNAYRVLKPGGTFIFCTWREISYNPAAKLAQDTLRHFFPVDTPAFYDVPFSYYQVDKINPDLHQAGFKNIKIESVKMNGFSSSAKNATLGLINGTPTITAIEERNPDAVPEVLAFLENKISDKFGNSNFQVPLEALIVTAAK